jgi:hypothetical protein
MPNIKNLKAGRISKAIILIVILNSYTLKLAKTLELKYFY